MVRGGLPLEQFAQLVYFHAHDREDVTQGSFGHVASGVHRNGNGAAAGMSHDMVAAADPG
jgi:hypothetical protein